jgi:hypothetical protein
MSMLARFVQLAPLELARLQVDPTPVEAIFDGGAVALPNVIAVPKVMQDRIRALSREQLETALSKLSPAIRSQVEEKLGRIGGVPASQWSGADIFKLMEAKQSGSAAAPPAEAKVRPTLSLEKNWHGVHYVLCGEPEPGSGLVSQAVLGGVALGDDEEGFSGYGPPRYFTPAQVSEISLVLSEPERESEAASRFDAARMSQLGIYPGWRPSDAEEAMDGFRRLRAFYADAAENGRAIVTCLV